MPMLRRAISSAVEHSLHTGGVAGSIPASPTSNFNDLARPECSSFYSGKHQGGTAREISPGPEGVGSDQVRRSSVARVDEASALCGGTRHAGLRRFS
jgi:hypothetical protein